MKTGFFDPYLYRLNPGATTYSLAHEYAHQDQCVRGTVLWRFYLRHRSTPYLAHIAMALMESEAALLATLELVRCRAWEPGDGREAITGLKGYFRAIFA